ncbi:spore germination protein [Bacillus horti]|uniref:Spore germination protein KA n=1 Tax=Caldalkalibacillus horti TaxID=77523 RepID=A0ABT9VTQ2_9BACI|nr:spore germination protein [Bacillus horti]MDQ0164354.1 spore germination protein KA [Bacillus horti]
MNFKKLFWKKKNDKPTDNSSLLTEKHPLSASINKNIQFIEEAFSSTDDLGKRSFHVQGRSCILYFIDTLANAERMQNEIIGPLQQSNEKNIVDRLGSPLMSKTDDLRQGIMKMMQGYCLILLENYPEIILVEVAEKIQREVAESQSEAIVRGAHDSFIENMFTNITLLRKRIQSPKLTVNYFVVGRETNTKLALVYMDHLANPSVVQELTKRVQSIRLDSIVNPGIAEELIEDNPWSIFPQMLSTERPDRVEANLMEGRVAILVNGNPTCLVLPVTFFSFYQSPDDYSARWWLGTFFRFLRLTSFIIAIALPAFYIAVISFHFEIIPPLLTFQVKNDVENIPFPPIVEAFILELTIELIREAGVRLPRYIGQTIGIVGGLVIGDAIVKAGLVSNLMIIVVALTALSSYIVPSIEMSGSVRLIRFPLMVAAAALGFIGIMFSIIFLLIHLCKLHSVKTPYFAPLSPFRFLDIKDTFIRAPFWMSNTRPLDSHPQDLQITESSREWNNDEHKPK